MFDQILFGVRVRELRVAKEANQTSLATLLGVTKTQISDIENGKTSTSIERLCQLADYFDVSLDYLVGRSDDPTRL
jgi:transcriptional regulator with XRE-family HTH domain